MASTCHYGNLHINEDLVYIELYDEQGREVNDTATIPSKMIVTNLVNRAQPLIRYEMNDLVRLGEKCPCGSNFRVIKQIIGRSDDILSFSGDGEREGEGEGEIIHIFPDVFSRWVITQNPNIREFRVVNNKINQVTVTIDLFREEPEAGADLKARLLAELSGYRAPSPEIEIVDR
jgi:phenylacetate-coenzyme A ligase PaaK-like adenylate-forming protein